MLYHHNELTHLKTVFPTRGSQLESILSVFFFPIVLSSALISDSFHSGLGQFSLFLIFQRNNSSNDTYEVAIIIVRNGGLNCDPFWILNLKINRYIYLTKFLLKVWQIVLECLSILSSCFINDQNILDKVKLNN